jgi:phage portal protein BeeE
VDEPVSKAAIPSPALAPATGGWWPMTWIREAFSGAWQRNIATPVADVMTFGAVFSCITLIATDIAKMHLGLVEEQSDGTAKRVKNPAYSPVLKKPNHYQNRIMFIMQWVISKLTWGNTYVLLERNNRGGEGAGNVTAMYVLDPSRVQVLVAPNGDVYYALSADVLAGIEAGVPAIPASEIIHDVMYPLMPAALPRFKACGYRPTPPSSSPMAPRSAAC